MLATSYFARSAKKTGAVSVARFPPAWYTGLRYFRLAPSPELLKIHNWKEYRRRYRDEVLATLDPDAVLLDLAALAGTGEIILLCFEKDRSHCHRSLIAEWFLETKGIRVPELGADETTQAML